MEYSRLMREEYIIYSKSKSPKNELFSNTTFPWRGSTAGVLLLCVIITVIYLGFYYENSPNTSKTVGFITPLVSI